MTNDEVVRIVDEALSSWVGHPNANAGDGKRAAEVLGVVKAALSSVSEDVARDAKNVRLVLDTLTSDDYSAEMLGAARDGASRLATAAARVPGLEEEKEAMGMLLRSKSNNEDWRVETLKAQQDIAALKADNAALVDLLTRAAGVFRDLAGMPMEADLLSDTAAEPHPGAALLERLRTAESERVAARQEAATWKKHATLVSEEVLELRARVAELEETHAEHLRGAGRLLDVERTARESAEARATAAEAKTEEWKRLAEHLEGESKGAFQRGYEKADADRDNTIACQSTPAPGLREAVGRIVPFLRCARMLNPCLGIQHVAGPGPDGALGPSAMLAHDDVDAVLAAYDTPEPTVTHASLAAVVEELHKACATCDGKMVRTKWCTLCGDSTFDHECNDTEVPCTWSGHEVLRRVTDGQVPEVLEKARVVEVLATVVTRARAAAANTYETGDPLREALANLYTGEANGATEAAEMLGLTLPTGPGGGETDCMGEECTKDAPTVGAHLVECPASGMAAPTQRARIPTPTPEGPALAQPEPAAHEVAWNHENWLRVCADGTPETFCGGEWLEYTAPVARIIARALAEAKREASIAVHGPGGWRDVLLVQERLTKDAARKAAEDMRERAALHFERILPHVHDATALETLRVAVQAIRALPLEAK